MPRNRIPKRRYGPRKFPSLRKASFAERFWQKVDKRGPDECWNWLGSKDARGYGLIYSGEGTRCMRAHRVALQLAGIAVPEYQRKNAKADVVHHACENTSCVNVAHLKLVPQVENCMALATRKPSCFMVNKMRKTCIRGHPFDTMLNRSGVPHRACSICIKLRLERAKAKKLAAMTGNSQKCSE